MAISSDFHKKSKYFVVVLYFYINHNISMCVICVNRTNLSDSVIFPPQIILNGLETKQHCYKDMPTVMSCCHTAKSCDVIYNTKKHKIMMLQNNKI